MRHEWPQIRRIGHAFLRDRPGCPRMAVGGQRHNIPAPRFITRDQAHAVGKTIAVDHHDPAPSVYRNGSEEHTSELQSLMRISYAVFCLKNKIKEDKNTHNS